MQLKLLSIGEVKVSVKVKLKQYANNQVSIYGASNLKFVLLLKYFRNANIFSGIYNLIYRIQGISVI